MNRHAWLVLFLAAVGIFGTDALAEPRAIFLVRHAERATISGRVPSETGLSAEGKTRAQNLARELKDAGITTIFTTEYKRTRETAAPLAGSSGIRSQVVPADDFRSLTAKIKEATGNVLVVGHSNTLPQIINALGVRTRVVIAESDYDNLFIVLPGPKAELIHLHYR
jgi:broad specificity phosphatase PhoE